MTLKGLLRLAGAWALAAAAPAQALDRDFQAAAQALLAQTYPADGPGAAVAVSEGEEVVYTAEAGLADLAQRAPVRADTAFRLGSLTKQFAAAVVLQLAGEGRLSLDDPVRKFVPGFPDPGGGATVRQLLNHTSGIQSYTDLPGWDAPAAIARPQTTAQLIARFADRPAQFEPGTDYRYNNSGYVLLAAVIEQVTGRPWEEAVGRRLTAPLGLTSIGHGRRESSTPGFATGYTRRGDGSWTRAPLIDMSVPSAAGALIGTAHDMARWSLALHGGKVVPQLLYAEMVSPAELKGGRSAPYGFGLGLGEVRGLPAVMHSGGIQGFRTFALYVPSRRLGVTVLTNSDTGGLSPTMVAMRLAAAALGDPYPEFTSEPLDPAVLAQAPGQYRMEAGDQIHRLTARGGKLWFRYGDEGAEREVFAAGQGRYFFGPESFDWFELVTGPGAVPQLLFHPLGRAAPERGSRAGAIPPEAAAP